MTFCDFLQHCVTLLQHNSDIWDSTHPISTSWEAMTCAKTCQVFHHITKCWHKELGSIMMSCITIYGIKKFNFRVVHPLCALLSKILLVLWTFEVFTLPHLFLSNSNRSPSFPIGFLGIQPYSDWNILPAKFTWNGRFRASFVRVQSDGVRSVFRRTVGIS